MATTKLKGVSLQDRLHYYTKINSNGCWEWQNSKNNSGYGFIRDGKKMRTVHRASYELHHNTIVPDDICVYHTCSNYICINPAHLVTGLRKDVTDYMILQGNDNSFGGNAIESCKHCNKSMKRNLLKRWHDDKCKLFTSLI